MESYFSIVDYGSEVVIGQPVGICEVWIGNRLRGKSGTCLSPTKSKLEDMNHFQKKLVPFSTELHIFPANGNENLREEVWLDQKGAIGSDVLHAIKWPTLWGRQGRTYDCCFRGKSIEVSEEWSDLSKSHAISGRAVARLCIFCLQVQCSSYHNVQSNLRFL